MSAKSFKKIISIVALIAFLFTNSIYAAPDSKSIFKNKKINYQKLSTEKEETLQRKKAVLQGEDADAKQQASQKKETQRILSSHLSDLSQIHIPQEIGSVIEVYQAENVKGQEAKPLVVHIQDLHTNPEASFNLAKILEILVKDYNLGLVCSEGADGVVDTSSVSSFPDAEVRAKVAKLFVDSGELTGEEYLSITKYPELPIWGIENKNVYFKNIEGFNNIMKFNPDSGVFISQARRALEGLKPKIYSKELLAIDQKEAEYDSRKIETADYLKYLTAYLQKLKIPTADYKNISILNETMARESKIYQVKIMQESQNLLLNLQSAVAANSSRTDMDILMAKAQLFKDQKISPFSFYSYLKDLAEKHLKEKEGLAKKYPNLVDFIDYLTKVNSLDSAKLFTEMEYLTYDIKQKLGRNEEEKNLTQALRNIRFLEGFFNLKISNEELDYYLQNRDSHKVSFFKDFLQPALKKYNLSDFVDFNPDLIDNHLQELEDFYKIAKSRDSLMFNNAVSEIEKRRVNVAALVSGGFHTRGITKLLKERGYSYVVIAPYSNTEIDEENYHFLLSGKRKPIEELIKELDNAPKETGDSSKISSNLRVPMNFGKVAIDKRVEEAVTITANANINDDDVFELLKSFSGNEAVAELEKYTRIHGKDNKKRGIEISLSRLGIEKIKMVLNDAFLSADSRNLISKYLIFGKGSIFYFWEELDESQKQRFVDQLETIDIDGAEALFNDYVVNKKEGAKVTISSEQELGVPYADDLTVEYGIERIDAKNTGEKAFREGEVGILELAGGSGSRLGYEYPKIMFNASSIMHKSLGRMRAEAIRALSEEYGKPIPWIIMTSDVTDKETREFFNSQLINGKYFNQVPKEWVRFKRQRVMPQVTDTGEFVLAKSKDMISVGGFGHGDARDYVLKDKDILKWLEGFGVKYVAMVNVDNAFMPDVGAIGYHIKRTSNTKPGTEKMSMLLVRKTGPKEKVGIAVLLNRKNGLIEYNQIPSELLYLTYVYMRENEKVVFYKENGVYKIMTLESFKNQFKGNIGNSKWIEEHLADIAELPKDFSFTFSGVDYGGKGQDIRDFAKLWLEHGNINTLIWTLDSFTDEAHPLEELPVVVAKNKAVEGYSPVSVASGTIETVKTNKFEVMAFHGFIGKNNIITGNVRGAHIFVPRAGGFAPIKDAEGKGVDTVSRARALYSENAVSLLKKAGWSVAAYKDDLLKANNAIVELSPAFSFPDGRYLKGKIGEGGIVKDKAELYLGGSHTTIGDNFSMESNSTFKLRIEDEYNPDTKVTIGDNVQVAGNASFIIKDSGKLIIDDGVLLRGRHEYRIAGGDTLQIHKDGVKLVKSDGAVNNGEKLASNEGIQWALSREVGIVLTDDQFDLLPERVKGYLASDSFIRDMKNGIISGKLQDARFEVANAAMQGIENLPARINYININKNKIWADETIKNYVNTFKTGEGRALLEISNIMYYMEQLKPYQLSSGEALMKIASWIAQENEIIPFEFGGEEGIDIDEDLLKKLKDGLVDIFLIGSKTGEEFIKVKAVNASKKLASDEGVDMLSQWNKWMDMDISMEDFNGDMFRDYDYRSTGRVFKPEMAFRFGLVWAKMALEKAKANGISDRRVMIARDARKIEPELVEALAAALRYAGLDVIYISAEGPNAVTSYSWAAQEYKPLMSIFLTASHVSRPKTETVRGFKVAILDESGSLQSLTTKEIMQESKAAVKGLIENPENMRGYESVMKGKFTPANVDENCVKMGALVGKTIASGKSLYNLARELESSVSPVTVLENWDKEAGNIEPFKGMKIVVEGAHTPSGKLAADTFKRLGANVILINGDVQEIEGEHNADPSKDENLVELKQKIVDENADFGIAFDLDGDRGAIVVPERIENKEVKFHTLAPDNLIVSLMPYMINRAGYNPAVIGKKVGIIRDVLGTFAVNDMSSKLGVETFQTDAGYVFLKAKKRSLLPQGYSIPIYGERSGHCWLDVTGEFENPIAVAVLFATMVKEAKYKDGVAQSLNPFLEAYQESIIPYVQSARFQPLFHPLLLSQLSKNEKNNTGWVYDAEKPKNPPQTIIALGKDAGIQRLQNEFIVGKIYATPAGDLKVREFNTYQDAPDEGGLYRFADIVFEQDEKFAGRFVFRASSNDPTFVCSFETPLIEGENNNSESLHNRYISVGGVVLQWLELNGVAGVSGDIKYPNKNVTEPVLLEYREKNKLASNENITGDKQLQNVLDKLKGQKAIEQLDNMVYGKTFKEVAAINPKWAESGFDKGDKKDPSRFGWTVANLKWILENPDKIQQVLDDAEKITGEYDYVIFCGMGGSGLSVQTVKTTFGEKNVKIFSLRTTDPAVIKDILENEISKDAGSLKAALAKTLVVPISKSGKTEETVSHKKYFDKLYSDAGIDIKEHMWVVTDKGSPMDTGDFTQREIQLNGKGDIGGRFTAPTTNIFLLPLALVAPEKVKTVLEQALAMNDIQDINKDTFIKMGAYFYQMASQFGKDKITFVVPEELKDLPMWSEQLFEESLGKDREGVTIFYGEDISEASLKDVEKNDRVFLRVNVGGEKTSDGLWKRLEEKGYPVFEINVDSIDSIGGIMLGLQRTVATIGYLWDICFVNQPAVEGYKKATIEVMSKLSPGEKVRVPDDWKNVSFGKIKLYYDRLIKVRALSEAELDSEVKRLGSTMDDAAAVYAAIINILKARPGFEAKEFASYGKMTDGMRNILQGARTNIFTNGLKMPSKLGEGPDKNHSYQQNIEGGKDMWLSTYFMPLQVEQPEALTYDDNLIKAQTLGTVNSITNGGRKAILMTFDFTTKDAEHDLGLFFEKVNSFLSSGAKNLSGLARKNQADSMDQIVAVSAADVAADKNGFENWILKLPHNSAVVIIAASEAEAGRVAEFKDMAYIKVMASDILREMFTVYGGKAEFFGGFKLGVPYSIDEYKSAITEIASGV
ncbi:MAG: UTP--glucose-1-phosphate uridylyltransferase [Candidatus Omnitrophota bacterium]|jgi:phosphomannomutase/UDP-N-acetylglucosamine pyrophosphorylase/glucose-6-phosphate isomerase